MKNAGTGNRVIPMLFRGAGSGCLGGGSGIYDHGEMKYPDGSPILPGDLVWWNEGSCLGHVQWIWDERRDGDYSWARTVGPPLFISGNFPYRPGDGPDGIIHDESCLDDEGVGPLSAEEREEFRMALDLAMDRSARGFEDRVYAVRTRVGEGRLDEWIFSIFEGEHRVEEIVVARGDLQAKDG